MTSSCPYKTDLVVNKVWSNQFTVSGKFSFRRENLLGTNVNTGNTDPPRYYLTTSNCYVHYYEQ